MDPHMEKDAGIKGSNRRANVEVWLAWRCSDFGTPPEIVFDTVTSFLQPAVTRNMSCNKMARETSPFVVFICGVAAHDAE